MYKEKHSNGIKRAERYYVEQEVYGISIRRQHSEIVAKVKGPDRMTVTLCILILFQNVRRLPSSARAKIFQFIIT